jgi:hypothetical protein
MRYEQQHRGRGATHRTAHEEAAQGEVACHALSFITGRLEFTGIEGLGAVRGRVEPDAPVFERAVISLSIEWEFELLIGFGYVSDVGYRWQKVAPTSDGHIPFGWPLVFFRLQVIVDEFVGV